MKKYVLGISALAIATSAILFTGCSKEDSTAPVVTLNGVDVTISLQGTYTELGATAKDDKDGDLTSSITITSKVDKNKTGVYDVVYAVTDKAGNTGEATRKVTVINDAEAVWAGSYTASEIDAGGGYTYKGDTTNNNYIYVKASSEINNQIIIEQFGDYRNNNVFVNVTGNNLAIPTQAHDNVGKYVPTDSCGIHNRETTSGTGKKTATGFTLTYADKKMTPCSGTRANVEATFILQKK